MNPLDLDPKEFEVLVHGWLSRGSAIPTNAKVKHLETVHGNGGDYEIDVVVEFEVFGGAYIRILVECKRYSSPVSREKIQILESKIRDTSSHKGMMFSTSGYQRGAIEFAIRHNIATLHVTEQGVGYQTKSFNLPARSTQTEITPGFVTINNAGSMLTHYCHGGIPQELKDWLAN